MHRIFGNKKIFFVCVLDEYFQLTKFLFITNFKWKKKIFLTHVSMHYSEIAMHLIFDNKNIMFFFFFCGFRHIFSCQNICASLFLNRKKTFLIKVRQQQQKHYFDTTLFMHLFMHIYACCFSQIF